MDLQKLKERRKGYTSAFGYCSCREDDFDWLIKQVEDLTAENKTLKQTIEEMNIDIELRNLGAF